MSRLAICNRLVVLGICLALGLLNLGCGGGPPTPDLFPVSGKVTYQGNPVPGAKIVFVSAKEGAKAAPAERPAAETDAQGNYEVEWGGQDGAPEGSYKVSIMAFKERAADDDSESKPDSLIPEKYNNPALSGLTATIKDGDNKIDFKLD